MVPGWARSITQAAIRSGVIDASHWIHDPHCLTGNIHGRFLPSAVMLPEDHVDPDRPAEPAANNRASIDC